MRIIRYYQSQDKEYWKNEIGKSDWSAAKFLYTLLDKNDLKKMCGNSTEVYLLEDDNKLISFAVLAEQDEIDAPELSPWIGFVYTFPEYRGKHNAGKLIERICSTTKTERIYISTEETGLYEKYGFTFWKIMTNREGKATRVYVKELASHRNLV